MKEKLLGSIVVSHYGPFAKGEADLKRQRLLDVDPLAMCFVGRRKDGSEVLTVLSRHGDDPELSFWQFYALASSLVFGAAKAVFF